MKSLWIALLSLLFLYAADEAPEPDAGKPAPQEVAEENIGFGEVFAAESNPGSGVLKFEQGARKRLIRLGKKEDHYGMGVVFDLSRLPKRYQREFGQSKIIQFIVGTKANKLQGRIPQFMTGMIVTRGLKRGKNIFKVVLPSGKRPKKFALAMFSSPDAPSSQSSEARLQSSYFASKGKLTLTPTGKDYEIKAFAGGKKVRFARQQMAMGFTAKLANPFNPQSAKLKGAIQIPVYWAKDRAAKNLIDKLALKSLSSLQLKSPRSVTGQ